MVPSPFLAVERTELFDRPPPIRPRTPGTQIYGATESFSTNTWAKGDKDIAKFFKMKIINSKQSYVTEIIIFSQRCNEINVLYSKIVALMDVGVR